MTLAVEACDSPNIENLSPVRSLDKVISVLENRISVQRILKREDRQRGDD
jgi:hypothetical protein